MQKEWRYWRVTSHASKMNTMTLVLVVMASFLLGSAISAQSPKCRPNCDVNDMFDTTCKQDQEACLSKSLIHKIADVAIYPLCMTAGLQGPCFDLAWRMFVGHTANEYGTKVAQMIYDDKKKQG
ncbi:hypothetical protein MSG28_005686 [Choristoneura fumiferana]|uniref:Uncharacterized protein n=1 Tax=Choristoneura fumiferana TaxID=7141 RepID=A0ACC0KZN0_CHOFU|nr:hypothetical protein MSG28_005686 [Choristoneura fumiferana]